MRVSSLPAPTITIEGPFPVVPRSPYARLRGLAWIGLMLIFVFVGGFGAWAAYAPLESAVIASGFVEVASSRKTVQHLEGGIIDRILVHDGEFVKAGQPLIQLEDTRPRTSLASLNEQLRNALAREARLIAERDGRDSVAYPQELVERMDEPTMAQVIAGQDMIFYARRNLFQSRTALIQQRVSRVQEEIVGLKAQEAAALKQVELINQELASVRELFKKGLERKPRLLALQRGLAEIEGLRGELSAQIAQAQQVIAESELSMVNMQNDVQNEIATALRETQLQISQLREQTEAARDLMSRTEIRAPEDGIVTALRVRTPGGVIAPGEPLLDLVPAEDRLIIKAQIRPDDIDLVHDGLPAQIRLTPFKHRIVRPLQARVAYISADHLIDERSGNPYYEASVEIVDPSMTYDDSARKAKMVGAMGELDVVPGMPAEVMIQTGETTVAIYALAPVLDSFNRAFREH